MNGLEWRRMSPVLALTIAGLFATVSVAQEPERTHTIPFFPTASDASRDGLARVINHSGEAGEVRIEGFDEEGESYGAVVLSLEGNASVQLRSRDLESGNEDKGLSGPMEVPSTGAWRLELTSARDIEVLSYFRTADGLLTAMHDTVPSVDGIQRVAFFNPGSNFGKKSSLRLINPGDAAAAVSIVGVDDAGESPGSAVTTSLPAGATRTLTAQELEDGGDALDGALGDGTGKWRLEVESAPPIVAMSLVSSGSGHRTNLSTSPANETDGVHFVPLLPAASNAQHRVGFVRIINRPDLSGEVAIEAFDDRGSGDEALTLSMGAHEAVQLSAHDLEEGNPDKGLSGRTGEAEGDWRLALTSALDLRVLAYVRTPDGVLSAMHDTVPNEGGVHRVAFFNPASNQGRRSVLRLINPGDAEAEVSITGVDDAGGSPGSAVTTSLPADASRTWTAQELEDGGDALDGALGDGAGKWQLRVESAQPIVVMSLLSDRAGRLTNLSTAPGRESQARADLVVEPPSVSNRHPVAGQTFTLSATVRNDGGAPSPVTALRYYRSSDATITASDRAEDTEAVAGLSASGSASASVTVSAPSTPGRYYYGACVDAVAEERDTANNCSAAVEVRVGESEPESKGQPDLMVASPTVSDDRPAEETTFILSVKVSNAGDGASPSATMRYHRSSDSTITPSDTPAGADEVAELGASGSDAKSVEQTAPSTPGTYYYGACVDAVQGESDTTNNCSASVEVRVPEPETESQGQPELRIPAVSVAASPGGTYTHDAFTLSATVRNDGDGDSAATTLRYYRSLDATITTSDTPAGTDAVAGLGASASGSASVELNAPPTPGTYYYGACVDAVQGESDTTNNCSKSVQVTVREPPSEGNPDLAFQVIVVGSGPSEEGIFVRFVIVILNIGDGPSAASTLRYFRSTDATITTSDTAVGTDAVPVLAPSDLSRHLLEVEPSSPGTYYFGVCVDAVEGESVTSNNCSRGLRVVVPEQ